MSTSLKSIRQQLLSMRAWHSDGKTLDKKIDAAINQALDRLAGDVPEALIPDEHHVVLQRPYDSGETDCFVVPHPTDKRLLVFVDKNGKPIDSADSLTSWRPNCTGEWDGIMHIEVKDPRGRWHRRQVREFFRYTPNRRKVRLKYTKVRGNNQIQVGFENLQDREALRRSSENINLMYQEARKSLKANLDFVANNENRKQNVASLVEALFAREGDNAYGKLRNYDAQTVSEQLAFAEKNGLNLNEVEADFAQQFNQRVALEGNKFNVFEDFGAGENASESFYSVFGLSPSYDTTRRYAKAKVGDIEYWAYGHATDSSTVYPTGKLERLEGETEEEFEERVKSVYGLEATITKNLVLSYDKTTYETTSITEGEVVKTGIKKLTNVGDQVYGFDRFNDFDVYVNPTKTPVYEKKDNENPRIVKGPTNQPIPQTNYRVFAVTLDRPWMNNTDGYSVNTDIVAEIDAVRNAIEILTDRYSGGSEIVSEGIVPRIIRLLTDIMISLQSQLRSVNPLEFRIYQPEFFLRDDVTELHEPAVVYDETRSQLWAIDTAGADRADMRDFQGDTKGKPVRMFRGRHFQLPAPTEAPKLRYVPDQIMPWIFGGKRSGKSSVTVNEKRFNFTKGIHYKGMSKGTLAASTISAKNTGSQESLRQGMWSVCYTYVWGRRDKEWQQSPNITPNGHRGMSSDIEINWAHRQGLVESLSAIGGGSQTSTTGIYDPTWESAPSPISTVALNSNVTDEGAIEVRATNIDAMMGFSDPLQMRFGRTGMRLRFYVSHNGFSDSKTRDDPGLGVMRHTETNDKFYLLCEVEPTYEELFDNPHTACRFFWQGNCLYDIERPLRHSTGYYAYKTYPVQDKRYELDLRVSRLPHKLIDDQDSPPIQRDAVSALVELAAYYVALLDGADQAGAQIHLDRYTELARRFRSKYANPARVVEPTSIVGGTPYRSSFNRFDNFKS